MNNIFENAEFGDKFRTRDGRKFVYFGKVPSLESLECAYEGLAEHNGLMTYYNEEGKSLYCKYDLPGMDASSVDFGQVNSEEDSIDDIIGKWQEPINEEELAKLATLEVNKMEIFDNNITATDIYKAGYRKAKEV